MEKTNGKRSTVMVLPEFERFVRQRRFLGWKAAQAVVVQNAKTPVTLSFITVEAIMLVTS
jgi:hypothetical protein